MNGGWQVNWMCFTGSYVVGFIYALLSNLFFSLALKSLCIGSSRAPKDVSNLDYVSTENRISIWRFFTTESHFFVFRENSAVSIGFHLLIMLHVFSFSCLYDQVNLVSKKISQKC